MTAPKTMTGRLCSGGAPLDLATALLALRDGVIPPTANVRTPAPGIDLDLVLARPRPALLRTALVLARDTAASTPRCCCGPWTANHIEKGPTRATAHRHRTSPGRPRVCRRRRPRGSEADLADTPFEELGYDSLALLETAGRLEREYHVKLTDEMVGEARTPQRLADLVNGELQRQ